MTKNSRKPQEPGKHALTYIGVPTIGVAATSSVIAIIINFATEWRTNLIAWLAVAALTIVGAGLSIVLFMRQQRLAGAGPAPTLPDGILDVNIKGRVNTDDLLASADNKTMWTSKRINAKTVRFLAGHDSVAKSNQP